VNNQESRQTVMTTPSVTSHYQNTVKLNHQDTTRGFNDKLQKQEPIFQTNQNALWEKLNSCQSNLHNLSNCFQSLQFELQNLQLSETSTSRLSIDSKMQEISKQKIMWLDFERVTLQQFLHESTQNEKNLRSQPLNVQDEVWTAYAAERNTINLLLGENAKHRASICQPIDWR